MAEYQEGRGTVTGWVGWIWFAGIMMVLLGFFNLIDGLVAVFNDDFFVATRQGLLVFDLTTWGWLTIVFGVLQIVIGFGLLYGNVVARIAGIIVVMLNAIGQLTFLSAYPIWSVIIIALDVLVLWALIVHGQETKAASSI